MTTLKQVSDWKQWNDEKFEHQKGHNAGGKQEKQERKETKEGKDNSKGHQTRRVKWKD